MSANVKSRLNAADAAKRVAETLGLDDAKRAATALAVAAAEEVDDNSRFAARVRAVYNLLPAAGTSAGGRSSRVSGGPERTSKALNVELRPIKRVDGFTLDPAAPLDPYLVYEAFGAEQLPTALDLFPLAKLQQAARIVMERNPHTKPVNTRAKAGIIEYI